MSAARRADASEAVGFAATPVEVVVVVVDWKRELAGAEEGENVDAKEADGRLVLVDGGAALPVEAVCG